MASLSHFPDIVYSLHTATKKAQLEQFSLGGRALVPNSISRNNMAATSRFPSAAPPVADAVGRPPYDDDMPLSSQVGDVVDHVAPVTHLEFLAAHDSSESVFLSPRAGACLPEVTVLPDVVTTAENGNEAGRDEGAVSSADSSAAGTVVAGPGRYDLRAFLQPFLIWAPMSVPLFTGACLARAVATRTPPIKPVVPLLAAHISAYFGTPGSPGQPRRIPGLGLLPIVYMQGGHSSCQGKMESSNFLFTPSSLISGPVVRNNARPEFHPDRRPTIYLLHPHGLWAESAGNFVTQVALLQRQGLLPVRSGTPADKSSPLVMLYDKKLVQASALGMYVISVGGGIDVDFLEKSRVTKRLQQKQDIMLLAGGFFETNCFSGDVEAIYLGQYPFWLKRARDFGYSVETVRIYNGGTAYASMLPPLVDEGSDREIGDGGSSWVLIVTTVSRSTCLHQERLLHEE